MNLKNFFIKATSTFLFAGYFPLIPGTFASFVGVLLYLLIKNNLALYIVVTIILTILGFLTSGEAEKIYKKKDPRCIVIDEVCGMLLALLFLPYSIKLVIAGFFIFRLLDVVKPYPAYGIQDLKGSMGVMSDDLVAGFYTNIVLQIVVRLASFKIS